MIPWEFFWWVATSHTDATPIHPPAPRGPVLEHTALSAPDARAFHEIEHDYWRHGPRSVRERALVWRWWLAIHPALILAVVLGVITIGVALLCGAYAIPGMAASTTWLCIAVQRCRRRKQMAAARHHHSRRVV